MKLNKALPVYVFDTSALLDFVRDKSLANILDENAQYFYHPITLAELADYLHQEIWQFRQPQYRLEQIGKRIQQNRLLIATLCYHNQCNPTRQSLQALHGRRFLPISVSFEMFKFLMLQRSERNNLCKFSDSDSRITVVANMVDHQILAAACYLESLKFSVTMISGDKMQLAAAAHLGISWVNSKKPQQNMPFQWLGIY